MARKNKILVFLAVVILAIMGINSSLLPVNAQTEGEAGTYSDDTVALLIKQDGTETEYTSLSAACQAATDSSDKIKLVKDSVEAAPEEPILQSRPIFGGIAGTYDLNGHSVSIDGYARPGIVDFYGDAIIKNGTINADLYASYRCGCNYTFEDITFTKRQTGFGDTDTKLTIKGDVIFEEAPTLPCCYATLKVCENSTLIINGDWYTFELPDHTPTPSLENNGTIICTGKFIYDPCSIPTCAEVYSGTITNNGNISVGGITQTRDVENSLTINNSENARLYFNGEVEAFVAINNYGITYLGYDTPYPDSLSNIEFGKTLICIKNASIGIDAPSAGSVLDREVSVGDETKYLASVKYFVGEDEDTNANAGYNKIYTAQINVIPTDGYSFSDVSGIKLNGNELTTYVLNEDGSLTLYYTFPETAEFEEGDLEDSTVEWDDVKEEVQNVKEGGTVTVDMKGTSTINGDVLDVIRGKDVSIVFDLGNGIKWTVNGKDVTSDNVYDINLGVRTNTTAIPMDVVNTITGEKYSMQISLEYEGEFGFKAALTININQKNAGYYANLFYYNTKTGNLEFMNAGLIDADGNVNLYFNHASDYTIVVSDKVMDGSNNAADTVKDSANDSLNGTPTTGDKIPIVLIVVLGIVGAIGVAYCKRQI